MAERPSHDPPGLDLVGLDRWMAAHVPAYRAGSPVETHLLAGGRSNVSYRLSQGHRSWVLRRPPLGHVMQSAHDMGREHAVLSGLARVGYPAPRPVGLCTDLAVIGAPFMLMDFIEARVIADAEESALLHPTEAAAVSAALVRTLVQLHDVNVEAAGLTDLGRPNGYLERQVRRWRGQWATTQSAPMSDMDQLATWLESAVESVPGDAPWSLVHGDYRLDNVMLDPGSLNVVAVLDWEMSTLGDPVADLAVALVYWSEPADVLRHRIPVALGVTDVTGFWSRASVVDEYARLSGRDLGHLDFCVALACYKLAVITESIHMRTVRGQQLGEAASGADMHGAAVALAALGIEVSRGAGVAGLSS